MTYTPKSHWIKSVAYKNGFLAIFLSNEEALLYGDVPSWAIGLIIAGTGRRSTGLAFNRLIKGKYQYQHINKWLVDTLKYQMEVK